MDTYVVKAIDENGEIKYVKINRDENLLCTYIKHVDAIEKATLFNEQYANKLSIRLSNEYPLYMYFEEKVYGNP